MSLTTDWRQQEKVSMTLNTDDLTSRNLKIERKITMKMNRASVSHDKHWVLYCACKTDLEGQGRNIFGKNSHKFGEKQETKVITYRINTNSVYPWIS